MQNAAVVVTNLTKTYPDGRVALRGVSFEVEPGEWLVFVGPSGCGKTTTLRILAGLEQPTAGTVHLHGVDVAGVPPWQRDVAMVFQRPALAPHRTVLQNLMLGQRHEDSTAAQEIAELLGLTADLHRYPRQLSGGQQQRAALGRSLARKAGLCLLDEPLGHLDAPLREQLRRDLDALQRRLGGSMISVTHDPREAWSLGRRIAVLHDGVVAQVDGADNLYLRPANRFIAEFFAQGPMFFLAPRPQNPSSSIQWMTNSWRCALPWQDLPSSDDWLVGLRAENIEISAADNGLPSETSMSVEGMERQPGGAWVTGQGAGRRWTGWTREPEKLGVGAKANMTMNWNQALVFDAATGRTLRTSG